MITVQFKNPSKVFNDFIFNNLEDYSHRTEVFYGGASSGKSEGVYQKVIVKALKKWKKPRKILVVRKVNASIRDSCWQHVKDVLESFRLLEYCHVNKTEQTIELPNGAIFFFKGLDDPEKIKSIKGVSDIVMEEATEFTLDDFTQLNMRLRDKHHKCKQMFLMFNPVSKKNWVYKYYWNEAGEPKDFPDTILIHTTYKDNKFLDDASIAELEKLKERNPAYYRIYTLGQFATLGKLIFPNAEARIIKEEEYEKLPQYHGLDFGYVNDPSAIIVVRYDQKNKVIYIIREFVQTGLLNNQLAIKIAELGISKEEIYADSQEAKSIDEIRILYQIPRIKPVKKAPNSVIHGIQWLLQHKIVIDDRCFKTIEEFENYEWKKDKNGEYGDDPVDSYNHSIDALRYAMSPFIMMRQKTELHPAGLIG